jgi:hypothetical protein
MKRVFITISIKKNGLKIQNKLMWAMQGDTNDVDNLIKEHKEIKKFANGEANKIGLKGSDIKTEVSDSRK